MTNSTLTIATRGSALALWQAHHIRDRLLADPDNGVDRVELLVMKTRGDKILDVALAKVGGKGLFVKELETALLDGRADLAVHSMKDVPSELPPGLTLGAVPPRANPLDAWVTPSAGPSAGKTLDELPQGAVVGTSSLRRSSQLLARRPDLEIVPIRGNLDTRLRKLDEGVDGMQALVLAAAGLERMGWAERITRAFPVDEMIPAVAQGALGIEIREGDARVQAIVDRLTDAETRDAVAAERALLRTLEGSCQVPLGGHAVIHGREADATLELVGFVATLDGRERIVARRRGPRTQAEALGHALGEELLAQGGREILDALEGA